VLTGHPRPAARPPRALRPWQSPRARSGGPRPQDDPPQRSGRGTAPTGFPPRSQLRNGRRQINGDSRGQLKPGVSKLWLVTELPGNPLRGCPHRDEHDREDDNDLAPKYFGRGHDDQGSSVACPKSKCRISSGVRTATAGYDSVGRRQHAVDGLLSEATRKTFTLREHFAF